MPFQNPPGSVQHGPRTKQPPAPIDVHIDFPITVHRVVNGNTEEREAENADHLAQLRADGWVPVVEPVAVEAPPTEPREFVSTERDLSENTPSTLATQPAKEADLADDRDATRRDEPSGHSDDPNTAQVDESRRPRDLPDDPRTAVDESRRRGAGTPPTPHKDRR